VSAAFAAQASASLVAWFLVNDRSRGRGVFYNSDFREWATLSVLCTALLIALSGLVLRRWLATLAVSAGCLLAGISGIAVFVAWAVFNSA
jgi:hypothetical protein